MNTYFAEIIFQGKDKCSYWFPIIFDRESDTMAKELFNEICKGLIDAHFVIDCKREPKLITTKECFNSDIIYDIGSEIKKGRLCKLRLREWKISQIPDSKPFVLSDDFRVKCCAAAYEKGTELPYAVENTLNVYKISGREEVNDCLVVNISSEVRSKCNKPNC
jgi:hypothetical protein